MRPGDDKRYASPPLNCYRNFAGGCAVCTFMPVPSMPVPRNGSNVRTMRTRFPPRGILGSGSPIGRLISGRRKWCVICVVCVVSRAGWLMFASVGDRTVRKALAGEALRQTAPSIGAVARRRVRLSKSCSSYKTRWAPLLVVRSCGHLVMEGWPASGSGSRVSRV